MRSIRRMIVYVRPYTRDSVLALLLLVGMVVADLAIPRLTQRVIDRGIANGDMRVIGNTALMMMGAAVLSALFAIANTIYSVRVGLSVGADIRSALVRKVQTFSFGNLDRLQTGRLLVQATSDVNMVQMVVMMSLRILTRAPLWLLGSMVMLVTTSGQMALIVLGLLPLILAFIWFFAVKARPFFLRVQRRLDRLNQVMQESLEGMRVVKAFVRDEYERGRFGSANDEYMTESIHVMQFLAILTPGMFLLVNLGVAGVIWFGGNLSISGRLSTGEIVASVNYVTYTLFPLMMLGSMLAPLSAADASAERIWEVLDAEPDVQERPDAQPLPDVRGRVVFEDVRFSYDDAGGEPVLNGVNLAAEPGQRVAILGATGSGKSSLIHLIPRFYDVDGGRILVDDVDVRDAPLHDLRSQIGIALQESVLFSGTVRDNIRYGRPDATDEEVVAAAKAAQAHDFIVSLPGGYDSMVGQRGVNLSGGQKQRIAIARALLVEPSILVLDDSTSAVDVETEIEIEAALAERLTDSTTFIVAQRISTVLSADKIIVLDRGVVAAEGTHAELLAASPIYREIYESQLGDGVVNRG